MLKKLNKKYAGKWFYDEMHSFIQSVLTFMLIDEGGILLGLWDGDLSKSALMTFGAAILRSGVKAILTRVGFSPKRSS